MTADSAPTGPVRLLRAVLPADLHLRLLAVILVLVLVSLSLARPATFPTQRNLASMALQISDMGVMALAMTVAIVIGGIDLSVVAVANLSAIVAAMTMIAIVGVDTGLLTVLGVVVALAVGAACGLVNGMLVGYLGVPAILATLATMTVFTGVATVLSNGVSVTGFPSVLTDVTAAAVVGVPVPALVLAVVAVLVWVLLARTPMGLSMYLMGANPTASMFSGVRNGRVALAAHVVSGTLAAVAGLIAMGRTNSASPSYGSTYVLVAILIAVLGGVAVTGGSGRVSGVMMALVILQMLSTGLNMLLVGHGDANFFKSFAWGLLLLVVVTIGAVRTSGRRRRPARRKAGAAA